MTRVSLRGLLGRKLRALLTSIAIVLGVAMISGTLVLTDTIDRAFDTIFVQSYAGTDAVVSAQSADFSFEGESATAPPIPEAVLERVRSVDGVDAAVGSVVEETAVKILDREGEPISAFAPTFGFGLDTSVARFNPLELKDGRWPSGPTEVAIDSGTAEEHDYGVGDRVRIATLQPVKEFEIVGVARYPGVDSLGGATFSVFDLPTAQALLDRAGKLDAISVAAAPGTTPEQLVVDLKEELAGEDVTVRTGVEQADEESGEVATFVSFIRYFLLTFGAIALFVGAFVIFNTLSITVAQRVRELATLRTIGASRRQLLGSVLLEAFVIGALSSVIGLFLGLALAKGLNALFKVLGIDLPSTALVFSTRTVIVALVVGVVVTVVAGLAPAVRATRVPPISAVREGATLPPGRMARVWPYVAAVLVALAVVLLGYSLFADDLGIAERLLSIGAGVLALFIGVALLSPRLVRPLAAAISPVATWVMLALGLLFAPLGLVFSLVTRVTHDSTGSLGQRLLRAGAAALLTVPYGLAGSLLVLAGRHLGGTLGDFVLALGIAVSAAAVIGLLAVLLGIPALLLLRWRGRGQTQEPPTLARDRSNERLARENSRRNPGRTAATAAALMIGIALVTFVAVLASGMRDSNRDAIERQIRADLIITSEDGYTPFVAGAAQAAASAPVAETVTEVREEIGRAAGSGKDISGIEPDKILSGYSFDWVEGSDATLGQLGANGALVADGFAEDENLSVGDSFVVEAPGGNRRTMEVKGIVEPPPFYPLLGAVTIPMSAFSSLFERNRSRFVFISVPGEPSEASKTAVERAVTAYPDARVQTRDEWVDKEDREFQQFLSMLYVLLALSVIVSIFGIINTLVLSVFERTRELGMLRAVGMTRRQVRRMIRHESIITALIGAGLGLPLGVFLGFLVTRALGQYDVQFKVPIDQLVIFAVVAVVVGIVAAILPARRAARLNVLRALQYE